MLRSVQDVSNASAQAGWPLTNTGSGFQNTPNLEGFDATVLDSRVAPAPGIGIGTLFVKAQADTTDANYAPSGRATHPYPLLAFGIVTSIPMPSPPPPNQATNLSIGGQEIRIRQVGSCAALCVTPSAAVAIAAGTYLTSDGNGNLMPFQPPSAAPTPTVTPTGTTGGTSYSYKLAAVSVDGVASALGTAGSTTTGNATLSGVNFNLLNFTPAADAAYYIVVRTVGGAAQGVIGIVPGGGSSFSDIGQAIEANTSATVYFPTLSAPGAPTVAQVAGATAGTTTFGYKVTAVGPNGVFSAESAETQLATAAATLSPTQANKVTWTAVTGTAYYAIDRSTAPTGYTAGLIGYSNAPVAGFLDYGQAASTFTPQTVPTPTPRDGRVLAVSEGALAAGTTAPTLTQVYVGGLA